jgi:hypothetical protein
MMYSIPTELKLKLVTRRKSDHAHSDREYCSAYQSPLQCALTPKNAKFVQWDFLPSPADAQHIGRQVGFRKVGAHPHGLPLLFCGCVPRV